MFRDKGDKISGRKIRISKRLCNFYKYRGRNRKQTNGFFSPNARKNRVRRHAVEFVAGTWETHLSRSSLRLATDVFERHLCGAIERHIINGATIKYNIACVYKHHQKIIGRPRRAIHVDRKTRIALTEGRCSVFGVTRGTRSVVSCSNFVKTVNTKRHQQQLID